MTDSEQNHHPADEPGWGHRRYPYGPLHLRLVMPIVGIVVGILFAVRGIGRAGDGDALFLVLGVVLVVLGIVAIPLARWMAKRGI